MFGLERPITEKRRQTGPHLYQPDEIREMRRILSGSLVLNHGEVFWPGIAEIGQKYSERKHFIWFPQGVSLAGEDKISIQQNGDLTVGEKMVAGPADVRLVGGLRRNFVLRTGHLIPFSLEMEGWYAIVNFLDGRRLIGIADLEVLLLQIETGIRPVRFSRESFIRVSNNLMGKTVTRIDLVSPLDRPKGSVSDHVLLRGQQIICGTITHPLTEFAYRQAKIRAQAG